MKKLILLVVLLVGCSDYSSHDVIRKEKSEKIFSSSFIISRSNKEDIYLQVTDGQYSIINDGDIISGKWRNKNGFVVK